MVHTPEPREFGAFVSGQLVPTVATRVELDTLAPVTERLLSDAKVTRDLEYAAVAGTDEGNTLSP